MKFDENLFNITYALEDSITTLINYFEGTDYLCRVCTFKTSRDPNKKNKKSFSGFIITDVCTYLMLLRGSFTSVYKAEELLREMCLMYIPYDGTIDYGVFRFKFPYIVRFFDLLNEWRKETGRATVDDEVIDECMNRVLIEWEPLHNQDKKMTFMPLEK